jgi:hypothetical protein
LPDHLRTENTQNYDPNFCVISGEAAYKISQSTALETRGRMDRIESEMAPEAAKPSRQVRAEKIRRY